MKEQSNEGVAERMPDDRVNARILIVEDEPALLAMLKAAVEIGGFAGEGVANGREAVEAVASSRFDAVLLDLGLPDVEGGELLGTLRGMTELPIIVVSGRGTEQDKIKALDLGADDYVAKPFLPGELLARIRAALRRSGAAAEQASVARPLPAPLPAAGPEKFGPFSLDPIGRTLTLGGQSVQLAGAEFHVFRRLAAHARSTVTRADLLHDLYGGDSRTESNVADVYISRIRSKLRRLTGGEELIVNIRGQGWKLRLPE